MSHENDCDHMIDHAKQRGLQEKAEFLLRDLISTGQAMGIERGYFFASASKRRVAVIDCSLGFARLFGYDSKDELSALPRGLQDIIPLEAGGENTEFYQELHNLADPTQHTLDHDTFFLSAKKKDRQTVRIGLILGVGASKNAYHRLLDLPEFSNQEIAALFKQTAIFGGMTFLIDDVKTKPRLTVVP